MFLPRPLLALVTTSLLLAVPVTGAEASASHPKKPHRKHAAKRLKPGKDKDKDGLTNRYEKLSKTNPRKADSDGDGIADAREDRDGDGVDNRTEQLARTMPNKTDSDHNGIADGAEDPDHDGLPNRGESMTAMHPLKPDTDGDGVLDGDENAGVITAVNADSLTIALAKGGDLVASLDEDSDLVCPGDGDTADDDSDLGDEGDDSTLDDSDFDTSDDPSDDSAAPSPVGDDEGDDPGDDDGEGDRSFFRSTRIDGTCIPQVGDIVYEADLEDNVLVALDLLGS